VRHNALTRLILIHQYVVRLTVGRVIKDTEFFETIQNGCCEVVRERSGKKGIVFGEGGGDGLETSMGKVRPSLGGNLMEEEMLVEFKMRPKWRDVSLGWMLIVMCVDGHANVGKE
jgi:hypothetical protein